MVMGAPQAGSLGLNLDLDLNKGVHLVRREGEGLKRPVFPTTRKISRLIEAVAILAFRVIWHVHTARNDGNRLSLLRSAGGVWMVSSAETSDGQTADVRQVQPCAVSNG
jgi:hypothetical protein